jgi:hypothetical protein
MPDNLNSTGGRDRKRVAGQQDWEINYMKEKFKVTSHQVEEAVQQVGNDRMKVEEYLRSKTGR